jgi:hypothetical protein
MLRRNLEYSGVPSSLILAQLISILFYLNANIVTVGEPLGTALPLLAVYIVLSGAIFTFLLSQKVLFFRLHFFVFLVFLAWIALRVINDLGDLEYLKQITIATTGGVLLFFLAGAFFNMAYVRLQEETTKTAVHKFVLLTFLTLIIYLIVNLFSRMREDIFLIADLHGDADYQRSGNFLSISFIMVSAIFVSLMSSCSVINKKKLKLIFWFLVYSLSTLLALISSQLFGSNSATAVMMGIYILTVVTVLLMRNRKLQRLHADRSLAFPFSKQMLRLLYRFGIVTVTLLIIIFFVLVQQTNFDVTSTRLLGFGSNTNDSLTSRFDILILTGADQMGYAPLLGNMNVAYLVTGNTGTTLHSFFPFILANLGLLGLLISLSFFFLVFQQLFNLAKLDLRPERSVAHHLATFYFILILLFLLLFANLTVGVTWPVIWFAVGFISQPFGFRGRI